MVGPLKVANALRTRLQRGRLDASDLVLAQQVSGALATRDANLPRAARKAGIALFE